MLSGVAAFSAAERAPVWLEASAAEHAFGDQPQHANLAHEFVLRNDSSSAVFVERVVGNCDCSTTELSRQSLAPGESATVAATWRIGTRHGPSDTRLRVMYRVTDLPGDLLVLQLTLRANILADFDVLPEVVKFRRGSDPQTAELRFQPTGHQGSSAKIVNAYAAHAGLDVDVLENPAGIVVTYLPENWPADREEGEVVLETNSVREPRRALRVVFE